MDRGARSGDGQPRRRRHSRTVRELLIARGIGIEAGLLPRPPASLPTPPSAIPILSNGRSLTGG